MTGSERIAAERKRQIEREGWTPEHDSQHDKGELLYAAICYATPTPDLFFRVWDGRKIPRLWPWNVAWWKPTPDDRVRELEKAGALIAAEIDRLLRVEDAS